MVHHCTLCWTLAQQMKMIVSECLKFVTFIREQELAVYLDIMSVTQ